MSDILGLEHLCQTVGVDYSDLDTYTPSTEYGRIVYNGMTVTAKATGAVTRFNSGDFKVDYSAARDFAYEQVRGKVNKGVASYCVVAADSLRKFLEVNTKYDLRFY